MMIAVASTNGKKVDLHFADTDQFLIYEIKGKEGKFKEMREKTNLPLDNHTERWIASLDLINDCKAVLCSKIGKQPTIELRKLGIKPIELECAIEDALSECSEHLLS